MGFRVSGASLETWWLVLGGPVGGRLGLLEAVEIAREQVRDGWVELII